MQLIEVPAKTGYVWFRQGIWLFRKNPLAFLTLFFAYLLVLGGFYLVAMALVLAGSALADNGVLLKVMLGTSAMEPETILNSNIMMGIFAAMAFYIPVAMLFWFSPVLTAWHEVPPVKAMFFSIVSCWRNRGAFVVFGALWFAVETTVMFGLTALMQALGAGDFAVAVLMPATIIVTTMLYCSFYATYRGCFGVPAPDTPDLPTTPAN
jgi:hypothetical protein